MTRESAAYRGDDRLLFGIIFGGLAFWLFNLLMVIAAIVSIVVTVPKGRRQEHMP